MFSLFNVAALNTETGEVVLKPLTVAAKNYDSAKNKAVAQLTPTEGKTLDQLLDEVTIEVRPF